MKNESIQRKLSRVKPPRVQITYDIEVGEASEKRQLPMVIGVISPLSGPPLARVNDAALASTTVPHFQPVTRGSVDSLLASIEPELHLTVPNRLNHRPSDGDLAIQLAFSKMSDFHPDAIVSQIPDLANLVTLRSQLVRLRSRLAGNPALQRCVRKALSSASPLAQSHQTDQDVNHPKVMTEDRHAN